MVLLLQVVCSTLSRLSQLMLRSLLWVLLLVPGEKVSKYRHWISETGPNDQGRQVPGQHCIAFSSSSAQTAANLDLCREPILLTLCFHPCGSK
jgi:hypothetical protein